MLGNWEWDPVSERFKCNEATFTPHAFAVRANVWAADRADIQRQLSAVTAERNRAIGERNQLRAARAGYASALECGVGEIYKTLRKCLSERDEARKECEEQARLNGMGASREAKLRAERDEAREECERLREALRLIASCDVTVEGDVVDIAQKALSASREG